MKTEYYNSKSKKLDKALKKYLVGLKKPLIQKYGAKKAQSIITKSIDHYPDIIPKMPFFNTPMYDSLIVLNSKMMALKKGMRDEGIAVEEYVSFVIESLRTKMNKIPRIIRNLFGKIFLSKLVGKFMKKVGKSATRNGWPTEVIIGTGKDDFAMKVCTKDCQMVNFMCSVGEENIIPYCSFADFANAEALGISLKQTSTIDSGTCAFCFNKKGDVYWPKTLENLLN